jgi:hypothetical protein
LITEYVITEIAIVITRCLGKVLFLKRVFFRTTYNTAISGAVTRIYPSIKPNNFITSPDANIIQLFPTTANVRFFIWLHERTDSKKEVFPMSTESQCSTERPCAAVQLLIQRTDNHEKLIDNLQNRLPPWVTGIAAGAGAVIGVLATLASK